MTQAVVARHGLAGVVPAGLGLLASAPAGGRGGNREVAGAKHGPPGHRLWRRSAETLHAIALASEMTVLDALLLARQHARGIRLKYRGKAATALVTQIDDLVNQRGAGPQLDLSRQRQAGQPQLRNPSVGSGETPSCGEFEKYE